jgi:transposase
MYPEWVTKHKAKGTNISCIKGRYYLYEVGSVWNKEKGRAQKITKKYLGRITEEGLVAPKDKKLKFESSISVKEYGASSVLMKHSEDIFIELKKHFPNEAEQLMVLSIIRVIEQSPFKRIDHLYRHSYLSEVFKNLNLSGKDLSLFLRHFGDNREKMLQFMRSFIGENEHILFDGTSIISKSEKMDINRYGYNAHREYEPQVNLLYAFSCESKMPVYYRIIPGNIRDVSAFKLSLAETKLKNLTIVADKGFGSKTNFELLDESKIQYIVPLRRNNGLFDASKLELGSKSAFDGYFMFNERPIWYYTTVETIVYLDNDLKNEEEKDYLMRIEKNLEGYTKEGFIERQYKFGTIVMKTNIAKTPQEIYCIYKERREIEQSFDMLKNLLGQDKTYMQNEKSLEAWAFINHISLMIIYKIYSILRANKLLHKFSIADFLSHLKYIFKIKADNQWLTSEISAKTSKLLNGLDIHIT